MQQLPFYDAVLAVTDVAINTGLQRLFAAAPDQVELDIDPDYGIRLTATIGPPKVTFLQNDEARITVPIVKGTYEGGTRRNQKTGKDETIETPLDGSSLSFTADVGKLHDKRAAMHEADFTIQELYLDLTKVRAIDTAHFAVSIEDADKVASVVNAFVEKLQAANAPTGGAAGGGNTPARLTLGRVAVPAVFDPAGSPFLPSHGTFSLTLQDGQGGQAPSSGDLNFLLMMGGRDLPTDKDAGRFDSPWTPRPAADGKPAHDGMLVISDYLLLEAVAFPIMEKGLNIPADSIALSRGDGATPARASLTKPRDMDKGVKLASCQATVDESGEIVLVLGASKSEPVKPLGLPTSISVICAQERTVVLQISSGAKGNLSLKVASDTTKELPPVLVGNYSGTAEEILGDIAAGLLTALTGDILPVLSAFFQSEALDQGAITDVLKNLTQYVQEDVNQTVELPGTAVFSFGAPRFEGRLLCYDADYIQMPALETPDKQPFQIGDFPRMGPDAKQTADRTEPVLVGEAIVNYRMVDDPDYASRQAQDSPYYILRREQYWSRLYRKGWPPHTQVSDTFTQRVAMSTEASESMEKTTHMRITAGCRLAFKDFASAEMQTEIGNELRIDVETTTRQEKEETIQQTITHEDTDTPYTAALWTIVDRFTLCRGDRYKINTWEYLHGQDHVEVDVSPPSDASKPAGAPPLTNPLEGDA